MSLLVDEHPNRTRQCRILNLTQRRRSAKGSSLSPAPLPETDVSIKIQSTLVTVHRKSKIVILTEGHTDPIIGKTAFCVLRYRGDDVVAVIDSTQAGKTASELLNVGGPTPIVASLDEAPNADTLLIGIATSGGKIPAAWRPIILDAISRGMDIVSGLHEFLSNDAEFSTAASKHGGRLIDIRQNHEHDVADAKGFRPGCLRIQTVGQDCSVGKMVAAVELTLGLKRAGLDAKFIATGQTGIMIEGDGCPVDCVVSDFVNGAVEKLVRANEQHDFLVVEGQGSIAHPRYSPVTLGLLHGARPQGMILCYEAGRPHMHGMPHVPLTPLDRLCEVYQSIANLVEPAKMIAVAANTRRLSPEEARRECGQVEQQLGLPTCDVFRDGVDKIQAAVLQLMESAIVASPTDA